jgi:hypothetical protein
MVVANKELARFMNKLWTARTRRSKVPLNSVNAPKNKGRIFRLCQL